MARTRQQRRGLSTVVGAVFMILVMVGAINVMLWTMQQQDRVTQTIIEKTNSNLNKLNEDIDISEVRVTGNKKLNMTVTNAGGAAATLKSIYIINETALQQYRYDVDLTVDGRESVYIDTLPLTVKDKTDYSIKVITESGNIATTSITPLSTVALPMSLYVIPPTVNPNDNVTILFAVTNNLTDSNLGWTIEPELQYSCTGCTLTPYPEVSSTNPVTIGKGSTALFKWVYKAAGPNKTPVIFNASLADAKQGNFVTEKALIKLVDAAQTSFSSEIVISSSLVQKPEIFLIIPGPFGDSSTASDKGLWGVVVANPTDQPMDVSRVVINLYTSKSASNYKMVEGGAACETAIFPSSSSEWSCPHDNMIEWKNVGSPQTINGFESKSFLAKIQPGNLGGASTEPAFTVSVAVFTSMGQFTKTGYSSSMQDTSTGAEPIANIFMTDTNSTSAILSDNTHIKGHINGLPDGQTVQLNVTIADFDTSSGTYVKSGSRLIVNVPRGFTNVNVVGAVGFNSPVEEIPFADGSTQLIATLKTGTPEHLGNDTPEAKVLSFTVLTPSVNATRVYVMHALFDGDTNVSSFSVGAIAELNLQVLCKGYPVCTE